MNAQLIGRTGLAAGLTFVVGETARLGRDSGNDVCVAAEGVSKIHATVSFSAGSYWVEDSGSEAGTFLNTRRVTRERLYHLDVISLGPAIDLVFLVRAPQAAAPERPVVGLLEAKLVALNGPEAGTSIPLAKGTITLGRATLCNVVVPSQAVSKVHARIERSIGKLSITDLDSSNGTFVNGARVTSTQLRNGDVIVLGQALEFRVETVTGPLPEDEVPAELPAGPVPAMLDMMPRDASGPQLQAVASFWTARYDATPGEGKEGKDERSGGAGGSTVAGPLDGRS